MITFHNTSSCVAANVEPPRPTLRNQFRDSFTNSEKIPAKSSRCRILQFIPRIIICYHFIIFFFFLRHANFQTDLLKQEKAVNSWTETRNACYRSESWSKSDLARETIRAASGSYATRSLAHIMEVERMWAYERRNWSSKKKWKCWASEGRSQNQFLDVAWKLLSISFLRRSCLRRERQPRALSN